MVPRRKVAPVPGNLLDNFMAAERASVERYYGALNMAPPPGECRATRLAAGEPVQVAGWEISEWFPKPAPFAMYDRLQLAPDGSLTLVRAAGRLRGIFGGAPR